MLRALTFGQCVFETPATRIAPDSEIHFALLLSIAAAPPDGIARDELVARIWSRSEVEYGRHCLRQAMYRLRQLAVPVSLRAGHIALDWESTQSELHLLLHGALGRTDLVRLGGVPLLPSYAPALGDPFGDWLEALRARVATRLRRALADEVLSSRGRGRFHEMGQVARALLALDPLNEVGTMGLAEALALEGSKVEALRLLEDYEEEVGAINAHLQLPVRVLRRRVAEVLDDSLALRRFEVPFVGRDREFGELRALLREVSGGESRAAFVTGEAGIGKSRLAGELLRLAALDGATLATYTPSAGDTFTPISTLVTVGQQLLTLPGALGCAQEHLSYIRRLGTPETVTAWSMAGMAADILYAQLVQAFAELVSAIAEEAPLVLFVDDAERLHPTTWRVLVDVWERVGARSVFFLLAARRLPGWFGSLGARSCERLAHQVRLFPFGREESLQFLHLWSEKNRITVGDESAHRCAATSQGNPFYLTELAAHLGRGGEPHQTPATIRELIAAQHAALGKGAQRVLLVIALFEARATTARVTQLLEVPAAELMAGLDELEEAGLVATKGPLVWCRHRLVGEVSKSLAMPSVLAYAHGRAAALLEVEADASDSVELLGDCVTHWEEAGETRRAFEAAMKLGYRLVGMGMGEEAEKAFIRAEGISESPGETVRALEGLLTSLRLAAKWYAVHDVYERRMERLRQIDSSRVEQDDFFFLALESSLWSNSPRAETRDVLLLASNPSLSNPTRMRAALLCAIFADNCYDVEVIRAAFDCVADILPPTPMSEVDTTLRLVYHSALGDLTTACQLADSLATLARASEEYSIRIQGLRRAAVAHLRIGNPSVAESMLLEVTTLTERLQLPHQTFATLEQLVDASLAQGQPDRARSYATAMTSLHLDDEAEYIRIMKDSAMTRLAWVACDGDIAAQIDPRSFSERRSEIPMIKHNLLSNEVALRTLRGEVVLEESLLDALVVLHENSRSMGRQDYSSDVLFAALRLVGRAEAAVKLAREYAAIHRRELCPPFTRPTH